MEIKKIDDITYKIEKKGKMRVPVVIYASQKLFNTIKQDRTLVQASNMAQLPGIVKNVVVLPDGHEGYGACIGGVMAFDLKKGIVSPGAVGYDLNCGVRLVSTNISVKEFMPKRQEILHDIVRTIPHGLGRGGKRHTEAELKAVLKKGSQWALENDMAVKEDLDCTEENGRLAGANPADVSKRALARGLGQLGTLGAGNHFLDIQIVEDIFDAEVAEKFGLSKDNVVLMIHCGSRGLGHQIASDYIKEFENNQNIEKLPDRELVHAPIESELGKKYLSAMACAVNFAFCNRQIIMHHVRRVLARYFPKAKAKLVYDVCHNIAKIEEFELGGKKTQLCVHRKGATRSFGPGRKEVPIIYREIGQPVLIPGTMGTASYVLVGTSEAEQKTFGSTAHGAGRRESRTKIRKQLSLEQARKDMEKRDIIVEASSNKTMIEENPLAYKDVDEVVHVSDKAGIGKLVAKLKPIAVMIG